MRLSKGECGFDAKLARHFHELSRMVQVILDKKDSAAVTINEEHAVVDKDKNCVIDNAPDQVVQQVPVAGNANVNVNQDDFDDSVYGRTGLENEQEASCTYDLIAKEKYFLNMV